MNKHIAKIFSAVTMLQKIKDLLMASSFLMAANTSLQNLVASNHNDRLITPRGSRG